MKAIIPYLTFDGNGREAMELYAKVFEAQLDVFDASQMPDCSEADKGKMLHATLHSGAVKLMASDNMSDRPSVMGNNVWVSVGLLERGRAGALLLHAGRGRGDPHATPGTPSGRRTFGMLTDRFGVHWMFNLDKPQAA